jgi:hypothetical protein
MPAVLDELEDVGRGTEPVSVGDVVEEIGAALLACFYWSRCY